MRRSHAPRTSPPQRVLVAERFALHFSAVQVEEFPFEWPWASGVVREAVPMCVVLLEAAGLAPNVEEEYRCEAQWAAAELSLAADRVLREICGSDLRPTLSAPVGFVAVWVVSVVSMFYPTVFCLPWSPLSKAAERAPRCQSAGRKEDYRDSRLSRFSNVMM